MGYVGGDSNVVGMWMRFLRFEAQQRNEAGMRHNFTRGPIRASAEAGPRHLGIGTYSIDRLLSLRKIIQVFVREGLYSWRSLQRCSTWFCSHLSESPTINDSTTRLTHPHPVPNASCDHAFATISVSDFGLCLIFICKR